MIFQKAVNIKKKQILLLSKMSYLSMNQSISNFTLSRKLLVYVSLPSE